MKPTAGERLAKVIESIGGQPTDGDLFGRAACLMLDALEQAFADGRASMQPEIEAARRKGMEAAAKIATHFFAPSTKQADISARECGLIIASAIRHQRGGPSE